MLIYLKCEICSDMRNATKIETETELKLTKLAEAVRVLTIFVKPGDKVERDASLFEYEDGKAVATYPSPIAGTVQEVCVREGDTVSPSTLFLRFGTAQPLASQLPPPSPASDKSLRVGTAEGALVAPAAPAAAVQAPAIQAPTIQAQMVQAQAASASLVDVGLLLYEKAEWPQTVGSKAALFDFLLLHREILDLKLVDAVASLTAFADGLAPCALGYVSNLIQSSNGSIEERRAEALSWIQYAMSLSKADLDKVLPSTSRWNLLKRTW